MMRAFAAGLLLLAAACRTPIPIDTSRAKLLPREVALDRLKETLPTVHSLGCTLPKGDFPGKDVQEWKIDDRAVEFRVEGKEPFRFAYAEITSTRLEEYNLQFQVRIYTAAQTNPRKDHFHFTWKLDEPARRAIEMIDAMRQ